MTEEVVKHSKEDGIATITLSRPTEATWSGAGVHPGRPGGCGSMSRRWPGGRGGTRQSWEKHLTLLARFLRGDSRADR